MLVLLELILCDLKIDLSDQVSSWLGPPQHNQIILQNKIQGFIHYEMNRQSDYYAHINIIKSMFLSDPTAIQSHLNQDWTTLLKNIKTLQDCHFELLQYNHNIINTVRQDNSELFVHDQISQHQHHNNQITHLLSCIHQEEIQIHQKYEEMCVREDGVMRLMGRVGARVLEICQNSIDKCKQYDQSLPQKHSKMRRNLIELLNNKDGVKLDQIIKCISAFTKEKLLNEQQKLKRLISTFQNGQYDKLKEVYLHKEKKQAKSVQRKLDIIRDLSKAKAQKESIKHQSKVRKQKQRIINHLYSPMLLAKQQLNDQQVHSVSDKTQKLYHEILQRNKFNSQQIIQFQQRSINFTEKTRIFKECMHKQEKKTGQIFVRRVLKKEERQVENRSQKFIAENAHTKSLQTQVQTNIQNIMTEGNIDPQIKNQKKLINTQHFKIKSVSNKKDVSDLPNIFTSFVITHQNFSAFKFDPLHRQLFTRTNRHILPDISSKGTSLDQNTQITKIKIDKILRTTAKKDFFHHEDTRKHQKTRKSTMSTRQQPKGIQETGLKFKGLNLTESLSKRVHLQRNKHELNNEDNPLHVKKAEIKYFQQKNTII